MRHLLPLLALAFCASAFSAPPEPADLAELKAAVAAADRAGANVIAIRAALAAFEVVPHPWGLCDMVGNVKEWTDSKEGSWFRIVRGGCWRTSGEFCRIGFRVGNNPSAPFRTSAAGGDRGFRVALIPNAK